MQMQTQGLQDSTDLAECADMADNCPKLIEDQKKDAAELDEDPDYCKTVGGKTHCKKSCGICKSGSTAPTRSKKTCADRTNACAKLIEDQKKDAAELDEDPDYCKTVGGKSHCKKTCGLCDK